MPVRRGGVPDEALEFGASQTARHGFALGEGSKCRGVAYLTAQLHAGYRGLQVIGVRQHICVDVYRVGRIGAGQGDVAAAFRPHHAPEKCPSELGYIESGRSLRRRPWRLTLGGLEVWSVETWVALPEVRRLTSIVPRGQRLLILPDTSESGMVLKVLADPRQVLHDRDAVSLQFRLGTDPRLHQHLGSVDC